MECSLRLDLTSTEGRWGWRVFSRGKGVNRSITPVIYFPREVHPQEILEHFRCVIASLTKRSLYEFGHWMWDNVFACEAGIELDRSKSGDVLFVVPPRWADIPFELACTPDNEFLTSRFCLGTMLSIDAEAGVLPLIHDADGSLLVVADPSGELSEAYDEGIMLKNNNLQRKKRTHLITQFDKDKLLLEIQSHSILHFAGRSFDEDDPRGQGWDIGSQQLFSTIEMEQLRTSGIIPFLVFSNSCYGGQSGSGMRGIAGALLKSGVPQVIGPIIKVGDKSAFRVAECFYAHLTGVMNVAQALYLTKKELGQCSSDDIIPHFYRLFGDPCYKLTINKTTAIVTSADMATPPKKHGLSGTLMFLLLLTVIVIGLVLLFFPLERSPVLFIPGR